MDDINIIYINRLRWCIGSHILLRILSILYHNKFFELILAAGMQFVYQAPTQTRQPELKTDLKPGHRTFKLLFELHTTFYDLTKNPNEIKKKNDPTTTKWFNSARSLFRRLGH